MTGDPSPAEEQNTGRAEAPLAAGILPLIETKVRVPRRQPDLLPRQRLVDFLHEHLDRRLILVSAPAGYGKTSLLADFAHDSELPVCWYTLDAFDRDLHVFLEYLVAAISSRFPAFGARSRAFLRQVADPGRDLYRAVAVLVQEITEAIPEYFVLVLDDHHTVEDQEPISKFLALFTTYMDENCHLVLASRSLPSLPNLPLLVARRQAVGLSIDEMRFTPHEVQALARQNYAQELSLEEASDLAERTGGWITGLLLSAAPGWQQPQNGVSARGRIDVGLYDYLSSQVLDRQPPVLREFLLASSVLDELSPELCLAVLGTEFGQPAALMEQVRARHLFVVEFEGDENRLRYHDLFHDFLSSSLRRQDEAHFGDLMRRAAQAYAARGEWERAVSRHLAVGDYDQVADIVEQIATAVHEAGRWDTLAGWIDALPQALYAARPRVCMHRGKIYMERGEHAAALAAYDRAEQGFLPIGDVTGPPYAEAMKGYVLRFQGFYDEALDHCHKALSLVQGDTLHDRFTVAMTHKNAGICHIRRGDLAAGLDELQQAQSLYEPLDDAYDLGSVLHDMGLAHELAGDLDSAMACYQAALVYWQQIGNPSPWANTLNGLGVVYHRQGRYDEAMHILNQALAKAQQAGDLRVQAITLESLGDVRNDLGAYEQAREAFAEAYHLASRADAGFATTYALDGLGNTYRRQGDMEQAGKWLQQALEQAEAHSSTYEIGLCCTSLGILANAEGNLNEACHRLDRAVELFQGSRMQRELVRARLHRAQTAFLAGQQDEAFAAAEGALASAADLACDQFLVTDVPQLRLLLEYAAGRGAGAGYLPDLLQRAAAHQARLAVRPAPAVQVEPQPSLRLYALGQVRVELNGLAVQWTVAQSRDLIFCLLQHPSGLRKEDLGRIFWPEHDPRRLSSILRSTLYRLRRSLFRESVIFENDLYRFNRRVDYWFDVYAFEELLARAEKTPSSATETRIALLEQALALYQGDYLAGIYDDWCAFERERLKERHLTALDTLAGLHAEQGDLHAAIELYQRIVAQEPYQEAAHQAIMRCYYRLGDRAAAIRQYHVCVDTLREDLGLSPMPETEELYLHIIN
jgi:LuxR family maltose regulon positive regulatory protein